MKQKYPFFFMWRATGDKIILNGLSRTFSGFYKLTLEKKSGGNFGQNGQEH